MKSATKHGAVKSPPFIIYTIGSGKDVTTTSSLGDRMSTRSRERRVRRQAEAAGYVVTKHLGRFMFIDEALAGPKATVPLSTRPLALTLDQAEAFLAWISD